MIIILLISTIIDVRSRLCYNHAMLKSPEAKESSKPYKTKILKKLAIVGFAATGMLAANSTPAQASPDRPAVLTRANIQPSIEQETKDFVGNYAVGLMKFASVNHAHIKHPNSSEATGKLSSASANYMADFTKGNNNIVIEVIGLSNKDHKVSTDNVSLVEILVSNKKTGTDRYKFTLTNENGGWFISTTTYDNAGNISSNPEYTTGKDGIGIGSEQLSSNQLNMIISSNEELLKDGFEHLPVHAPLVPSTQNQIIT